MSGWAFRYKGKASWLAMQGSTWRGCPVGTPSEDQMCIWSMAGRLDYQITVISLLVLQPFFQSISFSPHLRFVMRCEGNWDSWFYLCSKAGYLGPQTALDHLLSLVLQYCLNQPNKCRGEFIKSWEIHPLNYSKTYWEFESVFECPWLFIDLVFIDKGVGTT